MWAYQPLSGEGARKHGGRFNRPGLPALYTSLDLTTAWLEAQQGFPFKAQPMTMVAYRVDCRPVADLTDATVLAALVCDPDQLACPWEEMAWHKLQPPTWLLADRLLHEGFVGAIVPGFAPGCTAGHRNLVLWRWGDDDLANTVDVIDDFARLPKTPASWDST